MAMGAARRGAHFRPLRETPMTKTLIGVLMLAFVTSLPAMADDVAPEAQAAISKALAEIGCTVEADDLDATADGYEADDVKCKDGEFEVTFDKDFKIIAKEKDEY
jgi:hypothetical protein